MEAHILGLREENILINRFYETRLLRIASICWKTRLLSGLGNLDRSIQASLNKIDMRYQLLEDQISIYQELGANWSLWTYKDIGLQGLVSLLPDSKWMHLIQPILEKKAFLGVDSWGGVDRNIRHIMEPIEQTFAEFFPQYHPFPFDAQWQINRTVRHILLAEPLVEDFYPLLNGLDMDEIDELMASFQFENCCPRQKLCQIIEKALLALNN